MVEVYRILPLVIIEAMVQRQIVGHDQVVSRSNLCNPRVRQTKFTKVRMLAKLLGRAVCFVKIRNETPEDLCTIATWAVGKMPQEIAHLREYGRSRGYRLEMLEETTEEFKIVHRELIGVLEPLDLFWIVHPYDVDEKQIGIDEYPIGAVLDEKLLDMTTHSRWIVSSSKRRLPSLRRS